MGKLSEQGSAVCIFIFHLIMIYHRTLSVIFQWNFEIEGSKARRHWLMEGYCPKAFGSLRRKDGEKKTKLLKNSFKLEKPMV